MCINRELENMPDGELAEVEVIKGFKAEVSSDFSKGCSFKYFYHKNLALNWCKAEVKLMKEYNRNFKSRVIAIDLKKCNTSYCSELTELDDDVCLGCDKLQYDYSRGDL
ncbi:MAG: hypothetical protein CMH64_01615 [Nanoarchaeota archaeon]|jgi:hypothetical protein|nr:hypothetical protein [Nanoarchaeota archaeon]|tara:strand:- start:68 stop:394 length:327 start_codon:yes stop_codon:yes gene_type:complete